MNDQQRHWAGQPGQEYATRSPGDLKSSMAMFNRIFDSMPRAPESVIEFGAGVGTNLQAIGELSKRTHRTGVEVNPETSILLAEHCEAMMVGSLQSMKPLPPAEMTFTRGGAHPYPGARPCARVRPALPFQQQVGDGGGILQPEPHHGAVPRQAGPALDR